jgi:trimethylamine--corrinoid protein Co-methyltransferase
MQAEYVYPEVGDRASPKEWVEQGSTDIVERARRVARDILANHYPGHIGRPLDAKIRDGFPVKLPSEAMRPGPRHPG